MNKEPPYGSIAVARWIAEKSGWSKSNLALQKLVYLAHRLHLGRTHTPLISDHFEAWDFGPVAPRLYRQLKAYGAEPVAYIAKGSDTVADEQARRNLEDAWSLYKDLSGAELVRLTHKSGSPWSHAYSEGRNSIISNTCIRTDYERAVGSN